MDSNVGWQAFLREWFETPVGAGLLTQERALLDKELAHLFGYFLLQLGQVSNQSLLTQSRVKTKLVLDDEIVSAGEAGLVLADLDFLPIQSESVDVVVLPHTLEAVSDPYHLVRQVDATLMPEGRLVITGFNAYGCALLRARFGRTRQTFKQAHFINMHRVIDWLNLLGYDIQVAQHGPISCFGKRQNTIDSWFWSMIERFERGLERWGVHLGNVYIVVAKKRVMTPKPVGLDWRLANWLPLRKGRAVASCHQHPSVGRGHKNTIIDKKEQQDCK